MRGGRIADTPAWFPEQLPVEAAIARWAVRDRCTGGPTTTDLPDGGAVLAWDGCLAPVELHRLASGGHDYTPLASGLLRDMVLGVASDPMATGA